MEQSNNLLHSLLHSEREHIVKIVPSSVGDKRGYSFSVFFGGRNYPNFVSALYSSKMEAKTASKRYMENGKFDIYGTAESL